MSTSDAELALGTRRVGFAGVAEEVQFSNGGTGKIRSFWVGLFLVIITLGIYYYFWYYFVNDELKDMGVSHDDQNLRTRAPGCRWPRC